MSKDIGFNLKVQLIKIVRFTCEYIKLSFVHFSQLFYLSFVSYYTADTMDEHRHNILVILFFNHNVSIFFNLKKNHFIQVSNSIFLSKQAQLGFQVN
jgi:hypothetical protein